MMVASVMAESTPPTSPAAPSVDALDPGAPIAPGAIDPELVKLARQRPRVGVITAAGLVFLAIVFLIRLGPDRRFAGSSAEPAAAAVADVLAGKLETERLIQGHARAPPGAGARHRRPAVARPAR
jgi:hypothetical protein